MTSGSYLTPPLAPQATHVIRIVVTIRMTAPRNASLARTLTASSNPTIDDTVRFITRRS